MPKTTHERKVYMLCLTIKDCSNPSELQKFITDNKEKFGEIIRIQHSRKADEEQPISYFTKITGTNMELEIEKGFSSGYTGSGPNHFSRALQTLDVNDDVIQQICFSKEVSIDYDFEF